MGITGSKINNLCDYPQFYTPKKWQIIRENWFKYSKFALTRYKINLDPYTIVLTNHSHNMLKIIDYVMKPVWWISFRLTLAMLVLVSVAWSGYAGGMPVRHYHDIGVVCDSVMPVSSVPAYAAYVVMEARGRLVKDRERQGSSHQWWGIAWGSDTCRYEVTMRGRNADFGAVTDAYCVDVTASRITPSAGRVTLCSSVVTSGISHAGNANTMSVELRGDSLAVVSIGRNALVDALSFPISVGASDSVAWSIVAHGCWHPSVVMDEHLPDRSKELATGWTADSLRQYIIRRNGADRGEGIWKYFDRTNNPAKGVVAGAYTLATVRNADGGYDIIYIDGARTQRSRWHAGMLKGRIMPTIFKDHYDLVWYDAMMNPVSEEANASIRQDGALLEISLPVYETSFRLSRVPVADLRGGQ